MLADPYLVYLSYGHFTQIVYDMALPGATPANMVVKLLPRTVLNFDDPSSITIYQGIRMADPHELT